MINTQNIPLPNISLHLPLCVVSYGKNTLWWWDWASVPKSTFRDINWWLEINHGGSIYTKEIYKHYIFGEILNIYQHTSGYVPVPIVWKIEALGQLSFWVVMSYTWCLGFLYTEAFQCGGGVRVWEASAQEPNQTLPCSSCMTLGGWLILAVLRVLL